MQILPLVGIISIIYNGSVLGDKEHRWVLRLTVLSPNRSVAVRGDFQQQQLLIIGHSRSPALLAKMSSGYGRRKTAKVKTKNKI